MKCWDTLKKNTNFFLQMQVEVKEFRGQVPEGGLEITQLQGSKEQYRDTTQAQRSSLSQGNVISHFVREAFLPEGFPHSVSIDYWDYQVIEAVLSFLIFVSRSGTACKL